MNEKELNHQVLTLTAQNIILRDFIVWLLAGTVQTNRRPLHLLQGLSEYEEQRINLRSPKDETGLFLAEAARKEKDWILANALRFVEEWLK